jgi:predicted nucleic acid-binding protein
MLRVIFDTNIYGYLAKEPEIEKIEPKITHSSQFTVYGCQVIRKELRNKSLKTSRDFLLKLYDHIVKNHDLEIKERTRRLAQEYQKEAKKLGGVKVKSTDENYEDFLIVAAASLNNLDIVFSDDKKTMQGAFNIAAYKIVNLRNKLRSPTFYSYTILKKSLV